MLITKAVTPSQSDRPAPSTTPDGSEGDGGHRQFGAAQRGRSHKVNYAAADWHIGSV